MNITEASNKPLIENSRKLRVTSFQGEPGDCSSSSNLVAYDRMFPRCIPQLSLIRSTCIPSLTTSRGRLRDQLFSFLPTQAIHVVVILERASGARQGHTVKDSAHALGSLRPQEFTAWPR